MAVMAARNRAREERGVTEPELLAPRTAHPAFAKAAKYLGLTLRHIPIDADLRADVGEAEKMIGEQTALVVGSAPNYPFGTVDPIPELAGLAAERGISFHTDSCLGGFLLPFLERLHDSLSLPVLYVSHDMAEVERLADHLVLMEKGQVLAVGRLCDVQSDPSLPLAAARDASVTLEGEVAAFDPV